MSTGNLSNGLPQRMPDEVRADIMADIAALKQKITPYVVEPSAQELREMVRLSDGNIGFTIKTLGYLKANPDLCPPGLDVDAYQVNLDSVTMYRDMEQPLQQLVNLLGSSGAVCGSKAAGAGLVGYGGFKSAARLGVLTAKTIVADLGTQFAGQGTRRATKGDDPPDGGASGR